MDLDTSKAWSDATATVSANKEVLAAIAGVFFFVPALALALFYPQPEPPAGADAKQMLAMLRTFYIGVAPWIALSAVVQVLGQLAVLTLTARAGRVTVGEAIRAALGGMLPYIGSQLLVMAGFMLALALVALLAALSAALAITVGLLVLIAALWIGLRLTLVPVVVAVERQRNPVMILRRSWDLTRGNAGRILLFVLVLSIAIAVISLVAAAVVGLVLAFIGGAEAARIGGGVVSSLIGAGFATYLAISFAAMHRQLAGTGTSDGAVFD